MKTLLMAAQSSTVEEASRIKLAVDVLRPSHCPLVTSIQKTIPKSTADVDIPYPKPTDFMTGYVLAQRSA